MERIATRMTDMEIAEQQARVKREAIAYERGGRRVDERGTISFAPGGCSAFGERWTGTGWAYCPSPGRCKAQKTVDEQQKRKAAAV